MRPWRFTGVTSPFAPALADILDPTGSDRDDWGGMVSAQDSKSVERAVQITLHENLAVLSRFLPLHLLTCVLVYISWLRVLPQ